MLTGNKDKEHLVSGWGRQTPTEKELAADNKQNYSWEINSTSDDSFSLCAGRLSLYLRIFRVSDGKFP